jgi:sensor histidine kinase YesM
MAGGKNTGCGSLLDYQWMTGCGTLLESAMMNHLSGEGSQRIKWKIHSGRHVLIDLFYAAIMCVFIALFLFLSGVAKPFVADLIMSLSFGIPISSFVHLSFWIFRRAPDTATTRGLIMLSGVTAGTAVGFPLGPFVLSRGFSIILGPPWAAAQTITLAIAFGSAAVYFFYSKARLQAVKQAAQEERIKRLASEKEALEAHLRLLQAQVEPHFLFNTLSNVLSLIDTNPATGKSMLSDLVFFLRTSLSRTRPTMTTLGQEIDMVRAYLNIQKIRMGDRLSFSIDLCESARQHPFPPMLIQPLVENAVKHGLEPRVDGGNISVAAREEGDSLRIAVIDTGNGFSCFKEGGVGIANVRERINLLFGAEGRLIHEENEPHGMKAIIEIPAKGQHGVRRETKRET